MKAKTVQKDVSEVVEDTSDGLDADVTSIGGGSDEDAQLLSTLDDFASAFDVTGFKCHACGLAHSHDTVKHQLSETFALSAEEAVAGTEYNSTCHCSIAEVEMRGDEIGIDPSEVAGINAPIADEERVAMEQKFA